jgi:hypothetical protein
MPKLHWFWTRELWMRHEAKGKRAFVIGQLKSGLFIGVFVSFFAVLVGPSRHPLSRGIVLLILLLDVCISCVFYLFVGLAEWERLKRKFG